MGCTSSAPNLPESTANTTENDTAPDKETTDTGAVEREDALHEAVIESDFNDEAVSKVLPTCDSLVENLQLASNRNSFTNVDKEQEQDQQSIINVVENEEIEIEDPRELKLSLKAVADQVFLNNIFEDIDKKSTPLQDTSDTKEEIILPQNETEEESTEIIEDHSDEQEEYVIDQENVEEATSPSQSDENRSTRWEALADIAAELPPSLAVDPVTGQIYSLTK